MTKSWELGVYVAPEFSAHELSIGDAAVFQMKGDTPQRITLIAGVYSAVMAFKAGVPFELRCSRSPVPLVQYDGKAIFAADAVRALIADVESIIAGAYETGVRDGLQRSPVAPG